MKKAWKTILIIALCILIVGEIVLGVGLATGGSPTASGTRHMSTTTSVRSSRSSNPPASQTCWQASACKKTET